MPGRIGRVVRDTMLRFLFRYVVTDKSTAWMYDYRVDWDTPLAPSQAATVPASRAA